MTTPNHDDDVLNPINMARARHALNYNPPSNYTPPPEQPPTPSLPPKTPEPPELGLNSCFWLTLLVLVFIVGSVLGGIVGGGLILVASNNTNTLTYLGRPPTLTPIPTPTVAPASTPTPAPTLPVIATRAIEEVIAEVTRSLVTVINRQNSHDSANPIDDGRVVGSGVIIDERGYIATNHHVIKNLGDLSVMLSDGREIPAKLVASKADQDLALLKVDLVKLPVIHWGDSQKVRPGQTVYALGSPLGDFPNSVSAGIISGLNRALEMDGSVIDNLIQTDAAINRGSSGGPLINTQGEVIGLNTFIIRESEERGIAEGIAFSIPAQTVQGVLMTWVNAHSAETQAIPVGKN